MKYICKAGLSIFLILTLISCVSKLSSINNDSVRILDENTGYLFIIIESNINFTDFSISGTKNIKLEDPDFYFGKNYYLVAVPSGSYQVNKFGTYGLKYKFDEKEDKKLWGFTIEPGVISYVGDLRVRNIRYRMSTFELINNSSMALEYLEEKYPKILANRNLKYRGPGKDFFYDLVMDKKMKDDKDAY